MADLKEKFEEVVKTNIQRKGINELMQWLEGTDFYRAPASTRFHESYPQGLVEHSLMVYDKLVALNAQTPAEFKMNDESIAICALFHDLCKVNFYAESTRNVKDEKTGRWEKVPYYVVEDQFPFGHSEKSIYLLNFFMRLKEVEAFSIRAHMGFSDDSARAGGYLIGNIYEKCPAALNLHIADMQATYQKV